MAAAVPASSFVQSGLPVSRGLNRVVNYLKHGKSPPHNYRHAACVRHLLAASHCTSNINFCKHKCHGPCGQANRNPLATTAKIDGDAPRCCSLQQLRLPLHDSMGAAFAAFSSAPSAPSFELFTPPSFSATPSSAFFAAAAFLPEARGLRPFFGDAPAVVVPFPLLVPWPCTHRPRLGFSNARSLVKGEGRTWFLGSGGGEAHAP